LGKEGILAKGVPGVRIQGVDIFLASYQDMEDLRKCPYDVYIIDADSQWSVFWEHVEWIFRCDKILVLGVYRPWKYREVQCFMKQLIQHTIEIKSGDFYGTNVDREVSGRFYQEFHQSQMKVWFDCLQLERRANYFLTQGSNLQFPEMRVNRY